MGRFFVEQSLKTNRSGFSLIEMCMALIIFGVAFLLLMQFTLSTYMGAREARGHHVASLSAEKKMRELRIAPYTAPGSDKDTLDKVICSRSWSFQDMSYIKKIIVTVTYSVQGRSVNSSLTLTGVVK
jgi:prepilin-type N-terminal cleavage/methylation domain-containing protein